ncbi:MAG: NAD(P)-dependent glycerol-3-phosphate dehydrogenase [Clostridia bacterium]|nr:NAD(P)-dependent glycerol-3-phosphate dehydrogenase [Clostridia bacterium]
MARVSVLGAGGWGMALAIATAARHEVLIWSPFEEEISNLKTNRSNPKLLEGVFLPESIELTSDIQKISGSDITVIATPSFAVRETAQKLKGLDTGIITIVSKGFEKESLLRLSEVVKQELPLSAVVALSGPSHAEEVSKKIPTMLTAASENRTAALAVQAAFSNEYLRVYTASDIVGVELGGALKNIIAIAAGVCDGMGLGDNSKAALITRGLSEMTKLGVKMGASAQTFAGLTGMGDLIVTCTSSHSRNNRFGYLVGSGTPVKEALQQVGTVEGYYAAYMANKLAKQYNVSMPICELCYQTMYEGMSIEDSVKSLMTRPFKDE